MCQDLSSGLDTGFTCDVWLALISRLFGVMHVILTVARPSTQAHNELRLQSSLTDESLAHLAPLQRLEELSLKGCAGLQGPGLRHLVGLPNLRRLDLQACIRLTNKGARSRRPSSATARSGAYRWMRALPSIWEGRLAEGQRAAADAGSCA